MSKFPKTDCGFFHLTPGGWVRQDHQPFPADRVETWSYEMECPAEDSKEQVCLTRIWKKSSLPQGDFDTLRARFGDPLLPTSERNVSLECHV